MKEKGDKATLIHWFNSFNKWGTLKVPNMMQGGPEPPGVEKTDMAHAIIGTNKF